MIKRKDPWILRFGRNGMPSSPLSRRYDLKPPVPPANAPYQEPGQLGVDGFHVRLGARLQANTPAPLENAALVTRITQMRLPEVPTDTVDICGWHSDAEIDDRYR